MNEIIYYIIYKYVVRENIGVNFGFIEELSKTPRVWVRERGKQTLYKSKLSVVGGREGLVSKGYFSLKIIIGPG